ISAKTQLRIDDAPDRIIVSGAGFTIAFAKRSGVMESLAYGGHELIARASGMRLNLLRAFTDNDKWLEDRFYAAGLSQISSRPQTVTIEERGPDFVRIRIEMECMGFKGAALRHACTYT